MDPETRHAHIISDALLSVMRPLVRIFLRNGVAFHDFAELAKRAYVDMAMQEQAIPGRKATVSRVAVLTGLTRKEVQRIATQPRTADPQSGVSYNRAARVISGWVRDPDFVDAKGEPLALVQDEGRPSFAELVRRYSGDMPTRAVLDELLRVGAVQRSPEGLLRLYARSYIPRSSDAEKIEILGSDVSELIETIDHNMRQGESDPRFQRKVMYDNLPVESIPEFRKLSAARAQDLLEQMDKWLSQHDRDLQPAAGGSGRMRAGIGIYYFEEDNSRLSEKEI